MSTDVRTGLPRRQQEKQNCIRSLGRKPLVAVRAGTKETGQKAAERTSKSKSCFSAKTDRSHEPCQEGRRLSADVGTEGMSLLT